MDAHIENARVDNTVAHIDRADKNTSKGLLIGVIVSTVIALVAGLIYFLNDSNKTEPTPIVTIPTQEANPEPNPTEVVEKEVVKIVPVEVPVATPAPAEPVTPEANNNPTNNNPSTTTNNNITIEPSEPNQNSGETNQTSVASANENTAKPEPIVNDSVEKKDSDLKDEILKKFQDNLGSNKLKVEVKSGDVMVSGSLETQEKMQQVEPLLKSIEGINNISIIASVEPKVAN